MDIPIPKSELARILQLSRQSLYYLPVQGKKDLELKRKIEHVWRQHPAYGSRTLAWHLKVNRKRIQRVMHKYDLEPRIKPKNRYPGRNTKGTSCEEAPNRLKDLHPTQPNVAWSGDFTHLYFHGQTVHLATVIDVCTREILAWQAGTHHTQSLVLDVLEHAHRRRRAKPEIFHSDQGSEYTSLSCQEWLIHHDVKPSWSSRGKPWHNGVQESFYKTFKLEFGKPSQYGSLPPLLEAIGKYVRYYNTKRIHSALRMSPRDFYRKQKRMH
jgi:putative transposase